MFKNLNKVGYLPDTENYVYFVLKKFATINSEKKDIEVYLEKIQIVFTKIFGDIKIIDYDVGLRTTSSINDTNINSIIESSINKAMNRYT